MLFSFILFISFEQQRGNYYYQIIKLAACRVLEALLTGPLMEFGGVRCPRGVTANSSKPWSSE